MQNWLGFLLLGFFICIGSYSVLAQEVLKAFEKEMPEIALMEKQGFEDKTKVFDETNFKTSSLNYSVRLPKDWIKNEDLKGYDLKLSQNILSNLIEYFSPPQIGSVRQRILVQGTKLEYQMTAKVWLINYLLTHKYSLLGFEEENDKRAEALYVVIQDKQSFVVRSVAQINGAEVLFVEHFIPVEYWTEEHKSMQAQVLMSLRPQKGIEQFAEEMGLYPFLDVATMSYPESWDLRVPKIKSTDHINAQLMSIQVMEDLFYGNKTEVFQGQIDVEFVSRVISEGLEEELDKFDEVLAKRGLVKGSLIERDEELIFSDFVEFAQTEVFDATDSGNTLIDYEFWVTLLGTEDYYIFVTLLTPARDTNFTTWVKNTETYKVVAKNIKAQEADY